MIKHQARHNNTVVLVIMAGKAQGHHKKNLWMRSRPAPRRPACLVARPILLSNQQGEMVTCRFLHLAVYCLYGVPQHTKAILFVP
jgi:hypothetical protein